MPASTISIQLTCSFTAAICCFGLYDFAEARPPTAMLLQPSLCNMPANRPKRQCKHVRMSCLQYIACTARTTSQVVFSWQASDSKSPTSWHLQHTAMAGACCIQRSLQGRLLKCGEHPSRVETVRGLGFRWHPNAFRQCLTDQSACTVTRSCVGAISSRASRWNCNNCCRHSLSG